MFIIKRIIIFIIIITIAFFLVRNSSFFNIAALTEDLAGIPWLYSFLGLTFSILSGFIIQTQWMHWNKLVSSSREELDSLRKLYRLSFQLPKELKKEYKNAIDKYLLSVIEEDWERCEKGKKDLSEERNIKSLQNLIYEVFAKFPDLFHPTFTIFNSFLTQRTNRLDLSSQRLPKVIKNMIVLAIFLIVALSPFIAVRNMWLHYIFFISTTTLAYFVYLVIDDLDHPLRPGGWHMTKKDYNELLEEIREDK